MKSLHFSVWLFICVFFAFTNSVLAIDPLYDRAYIIVYGRDACGRTRSLIQQLDSNGLSYTYKIVDETAVHAELIPRMKQAGIDTRNFSLPVVDVNGNICLNPALETVASYYQKPVQKAAPQNNLLKIFSNKLTEKKTKPQKTAPQKTYQPGTLEISGIITGEEPVAIVDGQLLSPGDTIAGFELISIEADSVTFRSPDGETIVKTVE